MANLPYQEEEAEVVVATQKRKMLCKTRRGNLVIIMRSFSHWQPETKFSKLVTMGDHSPETVDETMSGNQFHCKNKQEVHFVSLVMFYHQITNHLI